MEIGEEIMIELEAGKSILISLMQKSDPDSHGNVSIFFKINGQMRNVVSNTEYLIVQASEFHSEHSTVEV